MLDSESLVKPVGVVSRSYDSEVLTRPAAKLRIVAGNSASKRDEVLTDFVRHLIHKWLVADPSREQKQLAALAGFSAPSAISNVKSGKMGVGGVSAPGFAKAFGFASVEAMRDAAYEWRKGSGEALDRRLSEAAVQRGIEQTRLTVAPPATDEEIRAIAASFVDTRFDERDGDFWYRTFADELKRDRMRAVMAEAERKALAREKHGRARKIQSAFRQAAAVKQQLEKIETEPSPKSERHESELRRRKHA